MQHEAIPEIQAATTLDELQTVKTRYVGKSGLVTRELGSLGKLAPEERKARGAEINAVRQAIQAALDDRETTLKREALDAQLAPAHPGVVSPLSASPMLLDVVYHPWPTPLAALFASAGATVVPGLAMLLHQAAAQVELMTGLPAPLEAMRSALAAR